MAHSFVKPSFIPSLMLALFLSSAVCSCSARTLQVSDICSHHWNPTNCAEILNTVPGVATGADLDSLSHYIINFAHVYAFETITMIKDLTRNTTDQQLKQRYIACSADYIDVFLGLNQAHDSCSSGDYSGLKSNGESVMKAVQDCDWKQPYDPSTLKVNNKYLEDVTIIITVLADFLSGKY